MKMRYILTFCRSVISTQNPDTLYRSGIVAAYSTFIHDSLNSISNDKIVLLDFHVIPERMLQMSAMNFKKVSYEHNSVLLFLYDERLFTHELDQMVIVSLPIHSFISNLSCSLHTLKLYTNYEVFVSEFIWTVFTVLHA